MKKARVFTLVLILCMVFTVLCPAAQAASAPSISARNAIVIEQNSGEVLYEKSADAKAEPASTTKIMTILLVCEAMENGDISPDDKVSAEAEDIYIIDSDASNAGIAPGEILTVRDLCYCAMLASANEATNILGIHVAGSIEDFVKLMNSKAEALGCKNTHFVNTNGLPDKNHYTTARELAIITQEALKYDFFRELCGTDKYTVPKTNCCEERPLSNSNALINKKSYYGKDYFLDNAYGVKTGHTDAAGYCLVSAVMDEGLDFLTVVLGATGDGKTGEYFNNFADTIKLIDYCRENYHGTVVLSKDETVYQIDVEKGKTDKLPLSPAHDVSLLLYADYDLDSLERVISLNEDSVSAPVKKGAVLGTVDVIDESNTVICSCELVAAQDVDASIFDYIVANTMGFIGRNILALSIIVLVLIAAAFAAVYIPYRRKGKK